MTYLAYKAFKNETGAYMTMHKDDKIHEATHVVMTYEEFTKMHDDIKQAYSKAKEDVKLEIDEKDKKIDQLVKEKTILTNSVECLSRIMTNRANAKRGLRPKKVRDGYIVLKSEQFEYRYRESRSSSKTCTLWRTVIQTPIDIQIPGTEAQYMISKAFKEEILEKLRFTNSSIDKGNLAENIKSVDEDDWKKKVFLLDIKFKQDTRSRLWEVTLIHNHHITIPEDMYSV